MDGTDSIAVCDYCEVQHDSADIYHTAYGDFCEPCDIKFHADMPKHHTEL